MILSYLVCYFFKCTLEVTQTYSAGRDGAAFTANRSIRSDRSAALHHETCCACTCLIKTLHRNRNLAFKNGNHAALDKHLTINLTSNK